MKATQLKKYKRTYVPAEFEPTDFEAFEPYFAELLKRDLNSIEDLEKWLLDASELLASFEEEKAQRYIAYTCDTRDEQAQSKHMQYIEKVNPRIAEAVIGLFNRVAECPFTGDVDQRRFSMQLRSIENSIDIFKEENLKLSVDESRLSAEYQQTIGSVMVEFDGRRRTLPQMGLYSDSPDRSVREGAFRAVNKELGALRDEFDSNYDKLLDVRYRMARNAGFADYRGLRFRQLERFDYGLKECYDFHRGVKEHAVPLARKLEQAQKDALDVDSLRPWDLEVDPEGRPPLRPFSDVNDLVAGVGEIFEKIHPTLGAHFQVLVENGSLDLATREGKAPGGYQYTLSERRMPFIFMNAAGMQSEVETLLHEGGHAFHAIEHRDDPVLYNRGGPIEFCEVASMSMEFIGLPFFDRFYDTEEEADRARYHFLKRSLVLLPWISCVDLFQHWAYTHPGHTREERTAAWLDIRAKYSTGVIDWSGLDAEREFRWQRQGHIFGMPFYYIEYGIAQMGALQVWANYRRDPEQAIADYLKALSLGRSRSLPELFEAAGIEFDFGPDKMSGLLKMVEDELNSMEMI